MNRRLRPWSTHRPILWAIGGGSLFLLWFALFFDWFLQGGFGPGSQGSPPGLVDLLSAVLLSIPCIYYIVVAHRAWRWKLWLAGIAMHALAFAILLVALSQDAFASILALPLLAGTLAWVLYAKRNTFTEKSG